MTHVTRELFSALSILPLENTLQRIRASSSNVISIDFVIMNLNLRFTSGHFQLQNFFNWTWEMFFFFPKTHYIPITTLHFMPLVLYNVLVVVLAHEYCPSGAAHFVPKFTLVVFMRCDIECTLNKGIILLSSLYLLPFPIFNCTQFIFSTPQYTSHLLLR